MACWLYVAATLQWVEVNPWSQQVQKTLKKSNSESRKRIALLLMLPERRQGRSQIVREGRSQIVREKSEAVGQLWHSGSQESSGGKTSWTDIICRL